mgnify:FL=1
MCRQLDTSTAAATRAIQRASIAAEHRRREAHAGCWLTLELADLRGEIAAAIAAEREACAKVADDYAKPYIAVAIRARGTT